jgi:hypothetical protein
VVKSDSEDENLQRWWLHMQQINEEKKDVGGDGDESEKKPQNDHKLKVVTVTYRSVGLMKEKIITFTILWELPNY